MTKPYTREQIKSELKRFGLSQQWLADKSHVSRQYVCGILAGGKWTDTTEYKMDLYLMFWTYLLQDFARDLSMARNLPLLKPKR